MDKSHGAFLLAMTSDTASTLHSTLYIGLMSGTSLDGVDGALVDIKPGAITTLASAYLPFPAALRASLMALQMAGHDEIEREALAANQLARYYAHCVAMLLTDALPIPPLLDQPPGQLPVACVPRGAIRAIGVHGQTIRHRPELGYTRQTNNPALLAELSGIDVIADFRSRDIAAGGQGAPLVPAFHRARFGKAGQTRAVVNIGGISNISVLHADGEVTGFDTGPGNVLMDAWIARHLGQDFDAGGAWAATGCAIPALLEAMLKEPYFALPAPKSTGRDLFNWRWLEAMLTPFSDANPADVQCTLTRLTALTIAQAILRYGPRTDAVYVCGGGAYNDTLLGELAAALHGRATVASTEALGVAPNRVEALAFAWLAYRFTRREAGNLAGVTGAQGERVLGALYPY
ncbi:MAG: anhydro-N-acetylmuramic acid kinase [Janthinobacterium sp.]